MDSTARPRILPIDPADWPPPAAGVRIGGIALEPKPELHVTLIGKALAAELQAALDAQAHARIEAAVAAQDWRFERGGARLLLRKPFTGDDGRRVVAHSVIERIRLPAMARLHQDLGRLLGRQLPVPPPHVTLYVAGRPQGIGVSSPARLRAFTVPESL